MSFDICVPRVEALFGARARRYAVQPHFLAQAETVTEVFAPWHRRCSSAQAAK